MAAKAMGLDLQQDYEDPYTDLEGHRQRQYILALTKIGAVKGSYGAFRPDDSLTREEAAVIIGRLFQFKKDPSAPAHFTDSRKLASWSAGYVEALAEAGIIKGYKRGAFCPRNGITRAESVSLLTAALCYRKGDNWMRTLQ